jgi:Fe-S-cluster containining protein
MFLPVVESCDGCGGSCCRHMVMPPFVRMDGDPEWAALARDHPELHAELDADVDRRRRENDWPDEAPCTWLDLETGRCRHHEQRPQICREFEVGSDACLHHRSRFGLPWLKIKWSRPFTLEDSLR